MSLRSSCVFFIAENSISFFKYLKKLHRFSRFEAMEDLKALWNPSWPNVIQYEEASILDGIWGETVRKEVSGSFFFLCGNYREGTARGELSVCGYCPGGYSPGGGITGHHTAHTWLPNQFSDIPYHIEAITDCTLKLNSNTSIQWPNSVTNTTKAFNTSGFSRYIWYWATVFYYMHASLCYVPAHICDMSLNFSVAFKMPCLENQ